MTTMQGLIMKMERPCALVPGYQIVLEFPIDALGDHSESIFYCSKAFDNGSGSVCCGENLEECHVFKGMLEQIADSQPIQLRQGTKPTLVYSYT
ncbi:MAG: hypothetical protein U1B79_01545 [Candidatus Pacearchaeota archaeon]|nr:hypothetical protein [Nanoarchaeota archaeon]MDZ4226774.1 hypothetical protein [Candidatus Pacearchaeota archaeon]